MNKMNYIKTPVNYIVDIGASDGLNPNPVSKYISDDIYSGLCIEACSEKTNILKNSVSKNVKIHNEFITPFNILQVFEKYNVPICFDILKIDIDGFDLEIIRRILSKYRPSVIIAEINEKIPPPIYFEVLYTETYRWDTSHFYGFSIRSGNDVMKNNNYTIVDMYDMNNILCVSNHLLDTEHVYNVIDIYDEKYKKRDRSSLYYNMNVDHWLSLDNKYELFYDILIFFTHCHRGHRLMIDVPHVLNKDFILLL
jgi:hypothetical protein